MSNETLYDSVLPKVIDVVRSLSALASKDTKFYSSVDENLKNKFEESSSALLELANRLLDTRNSSLPIGIGGFEATSEGDWKRVSDCLGSVFEKVDLDLDYIKTPKKECNFQYLDESSNLKADLFVKNKPQDSFRVPIDNSDELPFKPKLTSKPHAILPLDQSLKLHYDSDGTPYFNHPYEKEIAEYPYPESVLQVSEPIPSLEWRETEATWVNTMGGLRSMIRELEGLTEIAVDLEHHDLRSYYGITCLMQISNREKDWIIDTLSLRDDMVALNDIFTNPNILKVFHGASMDIIWLQRDLGLYVVSLFDTYFASKILGLHRFSLAFLLENFANFKTSKKFQLADWRVRPIPQAMLDYARADTHFLLNIYDVLRNKLVASGESKLKDVLFLSRKVAARKFEYQKFRKYSSQNTKFLFNDEDTARYFLTQYNISPEREQLVLKLFEWRDQIARKYDESPRFVMSNQTMVNLCQIPCPATMQQVRSCFIGNSKILLENSDSLFELVRDSILHNQPKCRILPLAEFVSTSLTTKFAREIAEDFRDLSNNEPALSNFKSLLNLVSKVSILNHCPATPIFSVYVPDSKTKLGEVSFQEFKNRFEFKRTNLESYTMSWFTRESNDMKSIEIYNEQPQSFSEVVHEEDSGEQLVTLLKNDSEIKPAPLGYGDSNNSSFDYKSGEISILLNSGREKNIRKRSFEPYNRQTSSGPRNPKGRRIAQAGKSASFVRRK